MSEKLEQLVQERRAGGGNEEVLSDPAGRGVTVAWLARVFRMDQQAVKRKLTNCPVKSERRRGDKMVTRLYDIATAAPFLVTPAFSTAEYMRSVRRGDLPPALQQSVWDALLKRQKWEENAGQLWRTTAIREVLGSTFQTIKFSMQLWVDTLEKTEEVTPAQRKALIGMVDGLQSDIYDALVRNMQENNTGPQLEEMGELVGESGTITEAVALVESEDDEIEQLI